MKQANRLLYLISRSVGKLKNYSVKRFTDAGISITPSQMGIIFFLNIKGEMNMSALSGYMGLDNSTLTRLVDKLARAGFVERVPNPADRRGFLVRVTEAGMAQGGRASEIAKEINAMVMDGFSEEEIRVFICVLESFFIKFNLAAPEKAMD